MKKFEFSNQVPLDFSDETTTEELPKRQEWLRKEEIFIPKISGVDSEILSGWRRDLFLAWQIFERAVVAQAESQNPHYDQVGFISSCREAQKLVDILSARFPKDMSTRSGRLSSVLSFAIKQGDRAKIKTHVRSALLEIDDFEKSD